jgi:cell shape-determining protein MreC
MQTKLEKQKKEIASLKALNEQLKQKGTSYDSLKSEYDKIKISNISLQEIVNKSFLQAANVKETGSGISSNQSTANFDRTEITGLVDDLRSKVEKLTKENTKLRQSLAKTI